MGFFLLRSDGGHDAPIGDFLVMRNLGLGDKKAGVGAGGHSVAGALGEAAEFICKGIHPSYAIGAHHQMSEFLDLPCDGIRDGVGGMCFGKNGDVVGSLLEAQWVAMLDWSWDAVGVFRH
jgi:hypothetical protein